MIRGRRINVFFLLLGLAGQPVVAGDLHQWAAQKQFVTLELQTLFEQVRKARPETSSLVYRHDPAANGSLATYRLTLPRHCSGVSVIIVETDADLIGHIGLDLFPGETSPQQNPIPLFLERFFLKLLLQPERLTSSLIAAEKIEIFLDGVPVAEKLRPLPCEMIRFITDADTFRQNSNDRFYIIEWISAGRSSFGLRIPARQDLILGLDKRELDQRLRIALIGAIHDSVTDFSGDPRETGLQLESLPSGILIHKGKDFFPGISSRCFYQPATDGPELVFDAAQPGESITNLLLNSHRIPNQIQIRLTIRSLPQSQQLIALNQLLRFFGADHDLYAGLADISADSIAAVLVCSNRFFNHLHLLTFQFPRQLSALTLPDTLAAALYPNIRGDNLKNLFGVASDDGSGRRIRIRIDG